MPRSSVPLVYCETNWIVALAFPHHSYHMAARVLYDYARRGDCELRLPYASILEARHPIEQEGRRLTAASAAVLDALQNALRNGWDDADFEAARAALGGGAVNRYLERKAPKIIEELLADTSIVVLRDPTAACTMMDQVSVSLNFRGKDAIDLFLIAAVVADRLQQDQNRPAVFFSTNKKEFQPKADPKAKLTEHFYKPYRMLWRDDFDIDQGVRHWQKMFAIAPILDT